MSYKIAIIGAGPAGATLARLLLKGTSANVTVYEADESVNSRSQGGTLDLRPNGGLQAIQEAGLWDEFQKYARYDGAALIIADKNLTAWVKVAPPKTEAKQKRASPEIDRLHLRKLLCDSLPAGMVRWNHRVRQVERDEKSNSYTVHFAGQSSTRGFDLVVGADGAWSKARDVLTEVKPYYYGIQYVFLRVLNVEEEHPDLYQLVNRGSVFTYSDGKGMATQYLSDGSLNVGVSSIRPENWIEEHGPDVKDPDSFKAALLEHYHDWDPRLRKFIEFADPDNIHARPLYMLPTDHHWDHHPGCTLVGDAAHLMTPYGGLGVNIAMLDGVKLAKAVEAAEKTGTAESLDAEIQEFERDMFERMHKVMSLSWWNYHDMFLVPGAPRARIQDYVSRVLSAAAPPWVAPFLVAAIRLYYFLLKLIR